MVEIRDRIIYMNWLSFSWEINILFRHLNVCHFVRNGYDINMNMKLVIENVL